MFVSECLWIVLSCLEVVNNRQHRLHIWSLASFVLCCICCPNLFCFPQMLLYCSNMCLIWGLTLLHIISSDIVLQSFVVLTYALKWWCRETRSLRAVCLLFKIQAFISILNNVSYTITSYSTTIDCRNIKMEP